MCHRRDCVSFYMCYLLSFSRVGPFNRDDCWQKVVIWVLEWLTRSVSFDTDHLNVESVVHRGQRALLVYVRTEQSAHLSVLQGARVFGIGERRSHSETFSSKQVIQWLRYKKVKAWERGRTKRRGQRVREQEDKSVWRELWAVVTEGQCEGRGGRRWIVVASGLPHDAALKKLRLHPVGNENH